MLGVIIIGRSKSDMLDLTSLIEKSLADKLEIKGITKNLKRGIHLVKKEKPAVVFLDIFKRKPFKFLENFNTPFEFEVIITSTDKSKLLEAIRVGVFDYLETPIDTEELTRSILRLEKKCLEKSKYTSPLKREIYIPIQNGFVIEHTDEIAFIEGAINYSRIHLRSGKDYLMSKTLKELEEELGDTFLRIHKSYLVNISHISQFSRDKGNKLLLKNGKELVVSFRRRDKLMKTFLK